MHKFHIELPEDQLQAYDPWYYPVVVNGLLAKLGEGTSSSHAHLSKWQEYRDGWLGDSLLNRIDLEGKSLVDFACNCGYWALRAARQGLKSYTGIEGREVFIKQGKELWAQEKEKGQHACEYKFIQGNVMDFADTGNDVAFCIGILYHLPEWQRLLERIAAGTRETIVIETRAHPERLVRDYPGDLTFNRIEAVGTGELRLPSLVEISEILQRNGWQVEELINPSNQHQGDAWRIAVIARRNK